MAFSVITPAMLLAYSVEGTKAVQRTSLDALFCLAGAIMLITTGGECQCEQSQIGTQVD